MPHKVRGLRRPGAGGNRENEGYEISEDDRIKLRSLRAWTRGQGQRDIESIAVDHVRDMEGHTQPEACSDGLGKRGEGRTVRVTVSNRG